MNLYGAVILATLVVGYVLNLLAEVLNLKALQRDPPAEFGDVYDPETYHRSQRYTRASTRLGLITSSFDLAVLGGFWFAGGFDRLDLWLRGFGLGPIATGLLFIGVLVLGHALLNLPFAVYATFVLEERFGFNRTDARTFLVDRLKGLAVGIVVGGPILALLLLFFERAGENAWLWAWLAMTAVMGILVFVFPVWILPLFNRFEPLEDGELRSALEGYARRVGFALTGVFVIDGSRRSSRTNAYFTGFGRHKRIALFDTLIEKHTVPELVAILAHEVGHYKLRHIVKGLVLSILHTGVMLFLLSLVLHHRGLYDAFFMTHESVYAGLVFFSLLYAPIELVLSLVMNRIMRRHEFEADRFASETIDDPEAMASALKKISADNLGNLTPHPFYVFLNHSHPPIPERVAAIRRFSASLSSATAAG